MIWKIMKYATIEQHVYQEDTHLFMSPMKTFSVTDSRALSLIADSESYAKGLSPVLLVQ